MEAGVLANDVGDGGNGGNGTSFNSETRRNGGRKAVVMGYADAAACAAGDQPMPRGHKLPTRHMQLVPTGRRLIARPGHGRAGIGRRAVT